MSILVVLFQLAVAVEPGIAALHAKDVAATLSGNPAELAELWTDDAVRLLAGQPPEVGKATIHAHDAAYRAAHPTARIASYQPDIRDVQVFGGWAVEYGVFEADGQKGTVLRVMKKLSDGSWRFARVMVALADRHDEADDQKAISSIERDWLAARDAPTLERILADDFVHPLPSGDFATKAQQIEWVVAHPRPAGRFDGLRVRLYGDHAIATGTVVNGNVRTVFTDVFVRRDGRWQAVNAQENVVNPR